MNDFRTLFLGTGRTVLDEAKRTGLSRPTFSKIVSNEDEIPDDLIVRKLRRFAAKYGMKVVIRLEPIGNGNNDPH